uniref:Glycerol-3-phosphate dehydrogenase n=1 Tax=Scolopendra viridis TaxID=118503 RepID=A0A4D5R8V8_SCOVI
MASRLHRVVFGSVFVSGSAAAIVTAYLSSDESAKKPDQKNGDKPKRLPPLPTRSEQLQSLQKEEFDVLVIGGGATGSGVALDAVSRGLKTAMVELDDFSSGTSSRSTKLIHGGVRYLQKAIMALDIEQYRMVKEALYERANLLAIAPHLSYPLPIMLPVYKWWQVPYYWVGIKMYDLVAGSKCLKRSYFLSKTKALELFPMLKKDKLCGAIVYYDGQHNDARMNLAIALTATRMGAAIANHVAVTALHKKPGQDGCMEVCGAHCKDLTTGNEFDVHAKCIINATGPFTDSIRLMDNSCASPICQPSSGVHVILPDYYSPQMMGLLDPSTSDGRVIFFLPWQGVTIAGTTDNPCEVTHSPAPSEADIQFILKEIRGYLSPDIEVRRGDVLSAWAGIRPLVLDPNKESTESIARNHIIHVSSSKLVTIAGGKWTTYRAMAKEAVDTAVEATCLKPESESKTDGLLLEGAHAYTPIMYIRLVQDFGLDSEVALHLANTYGDRAFSVAKLARLTGIRWPIVGRRLHQEFPYIEAEVRYAVKEYACSAVDVIARRLRLAFLNCQAAEEALPRIVEIMAEELSWSKGEQKIQKENAMKFLRSEMGMDINKASREEAPINLTREEIKDYIKRFQTLDVDKKGYISINDLRRSFKKHGEMVTEQELHEILREVDISRNGQVELGEYLQMMSARKSGAISHSRFALTADREFEDTKKKYSVERSGGGL